MNPKRAMMRAERDRKARIRRIRRENTKITKLGRGRYLLHVVLDHQSFQLFGGASEVYESRERAHWTATQLAIALNRFKFGD